MAVAGGPPPTAQAPLAAGTVLNECTSGGAGIVPHMRRLALATIAAIVLTTGTATAAFAPADSYPQLGQVLPIARAAWPDSPCRDREMISIEPAPLTNPVSGNHTLGIAWPGTCNLQLEDSLLAQPELMCWVVTHEMGHLAGLPHSTDPNDIMYPGGHYDPCHVLVAQPLATPVAQAPTTKPAAHHRTKAKCRKHKPKKRRACQRERARR